MDQSDTTTLTPTNEKGARDYAQWAIQEHHQRMRSRRSVAVQMFLGLAAFDLVIVSTWGGFETTTWLPTTVCAIKFVIALLMVTLLVVFWYFLADIEKQNTFDREYRYKPLGDWLFNSMRPQLSGAQFPSLDHDDRATWRIQWARWWPTIAAIIITLGCLTLVFVK